ncbi:bifunctional adenosine 5'-phosphosulfate phosphorylase/adenylylsulfatase HINT4 isoform X2 [Brachypodium distachyon]|uniref:HIT domain-containing protein n=1 Tax=Brachypodium distachyon TaxID=15368 RepID=A0A0Q3P4S6_BRADI|nr:bifunctional adenosine 5'-phosphosulfate phosphorylase/adenylylsulfatase HINT4 isoform X2 [Brachypodium distachyon]KQJ83793.1 hypothetical protein BRADI_5g16890v3 [Brachypodium distachyon]|eukprot:XP_014751048.1 bifunctional adenosine 5'-phosphosulfate phosphorylase/adenylylsulfatase HINT4 isoform X2 [Brachypodium distachyon]
MMKSFCFRGPAAKRMERTPMADSCVFCDIAYRAPASTTDLLYSVPMTRSSRFRTSIRRLSVSHMVKVGKDLLNRDAPGSEEHRFGFHQPPFNSVDHLHLHCLALPFIPSWRQVKYTPLGPLGGFVDAEKLLERINI